MENIKPQLSDDSSEIEIQPSTDESERNTKTSSRPLLIAFGLLLICVISLAGYLLKSQSESQLTPSTQTNSADSNNTKKTPSAQKVFIEGLVNENDIPFEKLDLEVITRPIYGNTSTAAKQEGFDTIEAYKFPEVAKEPFYCLPEGTIGTNTVSFYMGEARYRDQKTEIIFSREYLLKKLQIPVDVSEKDGKVVYCWRKSDVDIQVNAPDFGVLYWGENNNNKLTNKVIVFSGDKQTLITSGYFKNVIPLYLSHNDFFVVFQAYGGGWDDTEVISFDMGNMTFKNEDNCASLFPRSSKSKLFDRNCSPGIEGNLKGAVIDYGFERYVR